MLFRSASCGFTADQETRTQLLRSNCDLAVRTDCLVAGYICKYNYFMLILLYDVNNPYML